MILAKPLKAGGVWSLLVMFYLMVAGSLDAAEIAIGTIGGFGVLLLALSLGPEFHRPLQIRPKWLPLLISIPWAMIKETGQLAHALIRRLAGKDAGGRFIELHHVKHSDEHAPARDAWMALGICITPNSYLVHHDRHTGLMTLRQLRGTKLSRLDQVFLDLS